MNLSLNVLTVDASTPTVSHPTVYGGQHHPTYRSFFFFPKRNKKTFKMTLSCHSTKWVVGTASRSVLVLIRLLNVLNIK